CTNISCKLRGADDLVEHAMRQAGVREQGMVSADGLFTVEAVECLGACEYAPMMRLDHAYHYDLTPEKIDALIAERKGAPMSSSRSGEVAPQATQGRVRKPRAPRKSKADG
ncbi:MAG TPA: NAD(P)H-dependent oxidoreductase subunit E, partial [Candidatus Dormibacteraeota bacterium]|nr:NAD(P)H-dependent oxidoreductase subunit E [Candidatus Dormibacteraeota bacterium]